MTDMQTPAGGEFRDASKLPKTSDPGLPMGPQRPVGAAGRTFARWRSLVLDGRQDWGSVDVSPTRHGVTRYRLVLFPPGIDAAERRLLRAWRVWPTGGATLWVVSQVILGTFLTQGVAFAVSISAYLAGGAVLFARVAELRARIRTLTVVQMAGYSDERSATMLTLLKWHVAELRYADAQRAEGNSSPADHEATWWRVYDRLGQNDPGFSPR